MANTNPQKDTLLLVAHCFNEGLDNCFSENELNLLSKLTAQSLKDLINILEVMLNYDAVIKPSRDRFMLEELLDQLEKLNKANTEKRVKNYIDSISYKLQEYEHENGGHRKWLSCGINKAINERRTSSEFMCRLKGKITEIKPRQRDQKFRAAIDLTAGKIYQLVCKSPHTESRMKDFYSKMQQPRFNLFKSLFKSLCKELDLVGQGKLFNSDDLLEKQLQNYFIKK